MALIIATNSEALDIVLGDLGIIIPGASVVNLTDTYELYEIIASDDLKTQVSIGTIVISDGSNDLSKEDGLKHISQKTVYENDPNIIVQTSSEESITYSKTWVEKTKVDVVLAPGSYFLNWSYDIKSNTNEINDFCQARVRINNSNDICTNVWPYVKYQTFNGSDGARLNGVFSVQIDFRRQGLYQPVYIRNVKIILAKM